MLERLNELEVRILGALMEKQRTTPDYYPMTLNSLTAACNQTSNRDPVVNYDEMTIVQGLDSLRGKRLAWMISAAGSRVPKYEQRLVETLQLQEPEAAVLCLLMLRGPQTPGEIRSRSGRLYSFGGLKEVEALLANLASREFPLVATLPRQPGTREVRYAHLMSGPVEWTIEATEARPEPATLAVRRDEERFSALEAQLVELRQQLASLREDFDDLRRQLE
jgi:uncharacterized protein